MNGLLEQQLREPEEEARLRAAMPRLTEIRDETSVRVRQQYEENPYPRWTKSAPARPAAGIVGYLRGELAATPGERSIRARDPRHPDRGVRHRPAADRCGAALSRRADARDRSQPDKPRLRAAQGRRGGRTHDRVRPGRHPGARSGPELRRHRGERRAASPRRPDGAAGRSSCALLKPGGFMRLGLYSAFAARRHLGGARIRRGEAATTPRRTSIRSCRQNLMKSADARLARLAASPDFYSVSACRDLLFHVQEHRLTLPQIAAFLRRTWTVVPGLRARRPGACGLPRPVRRRRR